MGLPFNIRIGVKYGNVTYFYICYIFSIEATKFRLKHVQVSTFYTLLCPVLPLLPPATPTCQQQGQEGDTSSETDTGDYKGSLGDTLCSTCVAAAEQWAGGRGGSGETWSEWWSRCHSVGSAAGLLPSRLAACTAQGWSYLQIPAAFKVFSLPEQRYPRGLVTQWFLSHAKEEGGFFKERLLKSVIRCWETQT